MADKTASKTEELMKKAIALLICLLAIPSLALAMPNLGNYEKEAEVVANAVCDNGKTKVTVYEHQEYTLFAAVAASGETFLLFGTGEDEKFFVKSGNSLVEMRHDAWDAKLDLASPNWYDYLHDSGPSDCRKAE